MFVYLLICSKSIREKRSKSQTKGNESSDSEDSCDENNFSGREDNNNNNNDEETNVNMPPVISNEGYYWIGKDYSNTYKADFKDVWDFSRGWCEKLLVINEIKKIQANFIQSE